ncbi:MAG TPA: glycoside hydrolase family 2 TIM barrel-domain containing protein [Verrucomicrobiota bacterium]|nr:glycoside hydrolase family 2 TIM barrel-domain containing protein [Verrucomicrobiota bacterium]
MSSTDSLHNFRNSIFRRAALVVCVVLALQTARTDSAASNSDHSFCDNWRFVRNDAPQAATADFNDADWESVTLPHTARIESLVAGRNAMQWQGICWYRKTFVLPESARGKHIILRFEGAMNAAEIWINDKAAGTFMGGYLPYTMDVSKLLKPGATNTIAVRLDNRDNPITGPKPLVDLDFNLYSGLYRCARLIVKDPLHITDPLLANKIAGGGVFVTFPSVSETEATVNVRTHVSNSGDAKRSFTLKTTLLDAAGKIVASMESKPADLVAGADTEVVQDLKVAAPKLWSPQSPNLYTVRSEVIDDGKTVDTELTRIGIRHIELTKDGFRVNGQKMFLRGCNRHQEHPYIGYAVSDDAQYRDARRIKEAGFDFVRLSHYPQSPAFLDACDELGIVVMNAIMGWQYFNKTDPAFAELKYQECRQLVRRDRNHPSVATWEVSLNESDMPKAFIKRTHEIAHEEYPGDQCFTAGWTFGYDVFIQARQHGGCKKITDRPCMVSEYGDWEYFAQNAGLEQHLWKDLQPAERNSRQLIGHGEVRLLQQAMNFQEAHNDNRKTTAFADGIWVMFDYNRGYAEDIEASGIMDIFRLPKFTYWFFRSQRDAGETIAGKTFEPMVFIANYWTPESPLEVRVFSNCDEVALYLNDELVERRKPDTTRVSTHLNHPPFTFKLDRFVPGTLRAVGFTKGVETARHERRTPGNAETLRMRFDLSGRPFSAGGKDTVFCYVETLDAAGTVLPSADEPVLFGMTGAARLVGHNPILSEAGTASILVESDRANPDCAVYALSIVPQGEQARILSAAARPDGRSPANHTVHYTTDGSEPTAASPAYNNPIPFHSKLRAAIIVNDRVMAVADARDHAPSTRNGATTTASVQGN